jgi:hypothetical protein
MQILVRAADYVINNVTSLLWNLKNIVCIKWINKGRVKVILVQNV